MMTHVAYHLEDILFRKLCTEMSTIDPLAQSIDRWQQWKKKWQYYFENRQLNKKYTQFIHV